MRNILTIFVVLGVFIIAGTANASSVLLNPINVSVTKGQIFTIAVTVDPAGAKIYTVKSVINYPSNILEATAFTFVEGTPAWIPLSQPGYDSMTAGEVIKTAGFPGGFTAQQKLGTITFRAKESGTASIMVSPSSLAYDAQSKNTLSGTQGSVAAIVSAPAVAVPQKTESQSRQQQTPQTTTVVKDVVPTVTSVSEEEKATTTDIVEETVGIAVVDQVAAVGFLDTIPFQWFVAVALAAIVCGVWWFFTRRRV